jgi:hypothetical protein
MGGLVLFQQQQIINKSITGVTLEKFGILYFPRSHASQKNDP